MEMMDIAIVGSGLAGLTAARKLMQKEPNLKINVFEIGRPFAKRRRQLEGAGGVALGGCDGKLYTEDLEKVNQITKDSRIVNSVDKWVMELLKKTGNPMKVIKDTAPLMAAQKRLTAKGMKFTTHDHIQWKPEPFHKLSRIYAAEFDVSNVFFHFDTEVYTILKKKDGFLLSTQKGEFFAKQVIYAPGRTGFRDATKFFTDLGLVIKNDEARFGIRFEISGQYMKEWNRSHCSFENDDLYISPLGWNGEVLPSDHQDLVTSSFSSNEERRRSEKVSFDLLGKIKVEEGQGVYQTARMANLVYLLFNDRVSKEKVKVFLSKTSQLNLIPEYNWLKGALETMNEIIPTLIQRGYYWVPAISCKPAQIKLNKYFETEVEDLYVVGEASGIEGLLAAAYSGAIAATGITK